MTADTLTAETARKGMAVQQHATDASRGAAKQRAGAVGEIVKLSRTRAEVTFEGWGGVYRVGYECLREYVPGSAKTGAVAEAIARGEAAQGKRPKWKPVDVDNPGWLTARVEQIDTGQVEGVFYAQGIWQYRRLGYDAKGQARSYDVRDKELKRIAKAMIGQESINMPAWRKELIAEVAANLRQRAEEQGAQISAVD